MVKRAKVQTVEASVAVAALVATLPGCRTRDAIFSFCKLPAWGADHSRNWRLSSPGGFGLFPKLDDNLADRTELFLQVRDIVLRVPKLLHELLKEGC